MRKFEETGSVKDVQTSVHARPIRSGENIAVVRESVAENPKKSISRRSQQLGLLRLQSGEF